MKKIICLFALVVLLSGCVTTYHGLSRTGGYEETKIENDSYSIRFFGNSYCVATRADDLALLRCAELTLEKGFNYFIVLSDKTTLETAGNPFAGQKPTVNKTIRLLKDKPNDITLMPYNAEETKNNLRAKYKIR